MTSRRRFIRLVATGGAATSVGLYTWRIEPHWLEIVHRELPVRFLPPRLNGRTLVQISDVHVGTRVSDSYVLETFRRVAALSRARHRRLHRRLHQLFHDAWREQVRADLSASSPGAAWRQLATLGNHDYGRAWSQPEVARELVEIVQACGITVLRNEVQDVAGLQIAGLDDLWGGRFLPDRCRSAAASDPRRAALVLSHNPDTVDLPVWRTYQGWILAGHTHGGQCKPPFLPPPMLPVDNRRYTAGEFALSGDRRLYISRGVGHLLQVCFNVRPEVTVFELRSA